MAKDAFWFKHDSNARNDQKVMAMRSVYKAEGYGWYWMLVETMRDANAFRLQCDGKYWAYTIAEILGTTHEIAAKFVEDCIKEFELFESDGAFFWSNRLHRDMEEKEAKSLKAKESADKRWKGGQRDDTNVMRTHSEGNAIAMLKEEKRREKNTTSLPPSEDDVPEIFDQGKTENKLQGKPDNGFETFWKAYNKSQAKPKAEKLWNNLSKADREKIMQHVPLYVQAQPDKQFRKNPDTYLRNRSWEDEIIPRMNNPPEGKMAVFYVPGMNHTGKIPANEWPEFFRTNPAVQFKGYE
ncbi:DUF4373 domain-containing protein [Parasegetibacter sp. NRK P23]|uniref:DUF4373 domain-containing protein n=1 Tax=Parasegetibacter sp. NRK P23 TaxID=2942999 RepID=UPI002042E687|nr:DUF4373 domain-containing protein [Parasegetibacter sp. NRK P23]MCM5528948.1 DUF4373 domain-containing protein [Parasegetibacter sp. NRK P23]